MVYPGRMVILLIDCLKLLAEESLSPRDRSLDTILPFTDNYSQALFDVQ